MDDGYELENALKRAARDLGVNLQHHRPSREALLAAIRDYRELFRPQQLQMLNQQRRIAAEAMHAFAEFQPRLIGPLVHGDGPLDLMRLILIVETPEQVLLHLRDRNIPWQDTEVFMHHSGGRKLARPAVRFVAAQTNIELILLDNRTRSDPPRDPLTGGPLEMLGADQLNALIDAAV